MERLRPAMEEDATFKGKIGLLLQIHHVLNFREVIVMTPIGQQLVSTHPQLLLTNAHISKFSTKLRRRETSAQELVQKPLVLPKSADGEKSDRFHREPNGIHQQTSLSEQMYMELHSMIRIHGL